MSRGILRMSLVGLVFGATLLTIADDADARRRCRARRTRCCAVRTYAAPTCCAPAPTCAAPSCCAPVYSAPVAPAGEVAPPANLPEPPAEPKA